MEAYEVKQEVAKRLFMTRMVWIVMLASLGIYLFLAYYLQNMANFKPPSPAPPITLAYLLMGAGVISTLIGVLGAKGVLPIFEGTRTWPTMPPQGVAEGKSPDIIMGKIFTSTVFCCALSESAAIFGLVIFFLYGSFEKLFLMAIIAAAGMATVFPTLEKFMEAIGKDQIPTDSPP